eukprot:scaffold32825_cov19-Tisochrysis_lutea.AAC.1
MHPRLLPLGMHPTALFRKAVLCVLCLPSPHGVLACNALCACVLRMSSDLCCRRALQSLLPLSKSKQRRAAAAGSTAYAAHSNGLHALCAGQCFAGQARCHRASSTGSQQQGAPHVQLIPTDCMLSVQANALRAKLAATEQAAQDASSREHELLGRIKALSEASASAAQQHAKQAILYARVGFQICVGKIRPKRAASAPISVCAGAIPTCKESISSFGLQSLLNSFCKHAEVSVKRPPTRKPCWRSDWLTARFSYLCQPQAGCFERPLSSIWYIATCCANREQTRLWMVDAVLSGTMTWSPYGM